MSDRVFSLVSPTGESVILDTSGGGPYALQTNTSGIGWPTRVNQYADSAGDGGEIRGSRYAMRSLDLTILTIGDSRADIEAKLNRLGHVLDPPTGRSKLLCEFADGQAWELPFVYEFGLEGDGTVSGPTWSRNTVALRCPDPFWVARDGIEFELAATSDEIADLAEDLAELPVGLATLTGTIELENPGDVEAPITWIVQGPADSFSISVDGATLVFDSPIAADERIIVDTGARTVASQSGDLQVLARNVFPNPSFEAAAGSISTPEGTRPVPAGVVNDGDPLVWQSEVRGFQGPHSLAFFFPQVGFFPDEFYPDDDSFPV